MTCDRRFRPVGPSMACPLWYHSGHRQRPLSHATSTPDRAVIASPRWPLPRPEPRSAVLTEARAAYGCGQVVRGLLGRFLIEFIFAAGAQAVLPAVPAVELAITAQTRGISGIRAVFRGSALGAFARPCLAHSSPSPCAAIRPSTRASGPLAARHRNPTAQLLTRGWLVTAQVI
jgi:hypothetical protein